MSISSPAARKAVMEMVAKALAEGITPLELGQAMLFHGIGLTSPANATFHDLANQLVKLAAIIRSKKGDPRG